MYGADNGNKVEQSCINTWKKQTKYSDTIKRCDVISSSEYQSPYENCSACTFIKGPMFLFYYDERKECLRHLVLHILFFLEAFTIHLHAIFLQKINSVIIAIYSIASNEEFCITIIQLLQIWIALVSSWLIFQVNFMAFLGEKITHIYRGLEMAYICRYFCVRPLNNFSHELGWFVSYWSFYWEEVVALYSALVTVQIKILKHT